MHRLAVTIERQTDIIGGCGFKQTRHKGGQPKRLLGASLRRSSSRRMAAFMVSREKKVWWRSASRMRVWTALTELSTRPLSVAQY